MWSTTMYDELSNDYDRFVNWPSRLALELPFLQAQLAQHRAHRVLDSACGTGQHAIALAGLGFEVVGTDASAAMIDVARTNAAGHPHLRFAVAAFGHTQSVVGGGFDALLCLGNSLPHLLTPESLTEALADMAACLRPGGLLMIQNRNFDRVVTRKERWMEPQTHREGDHEWLFLRFYDWEPGGLIGFNMLTLRREGSGPWGQRVSRSLLRPQLRDELESALQQAGFAQTRVYGDLAGSAFDPLSSGNVVVIGALPATAPEHLR